MYLINICVFPYFISYLHFHSFLNIFIFDHICILIFHLRYVFSYSFLSIFGFDHIFIHHFSQYICITFLFYNIVPFLKLFFILNMYAICICSFLFSVYSTFILKICQLYLHFIYKNVCNRYSLVPFSSSFLHRVVLLLYWILMYIQCLKNNDIYTRIRLLSIFSLSIFLKFLC